MHLTTNFKEATTIIVIEHRPHNLKNSLNFFPDKTKQPVD